MDFFEQQDHARRKTKWLVIYFALAVISMIVMIYGVAVFASGYVASKQHHHYYDGAQPSFALWNPELFLGVTLGTLVVIFLGSAWKTAALAAGGSAVAESLNGRLIASNTNNPDERKLLNVVEEMSIASGVPMPKVYVLDEEDGINAFAAGHTPSDAAVAVTRNCMTKLSRDELQGVIGHEFSHILNGDMRLNIRLIGILFGIFCIATIGRILLYARSSNSRDKNPLPVHRHFSVDHRFARRFFWPADPGRRQPPARIPGRRLVRAVHAQSRRPFRRAPENRRRMVRAWNRRTLPTPATCFSPTDWRLVVRRDGHAPAAGGTDPGD